jgi:hypothetical protein
MNLRSFLLTLTLASALDAQPAKPVPPVAPSVIEQPDAHHLRDELTRILGHYPPALHTVLATDPSLLANQSYLAPYPALAAFLAAHPEILRDPTYYIGGSGFDPNRYRQENSNTTPSERIWESTLRDISSFFGLAMGFSLLVWLVRTFIDYRRWNRLTKIQTDVHTKLLDRFANSDELLTYIKTPAGARFLESSPIALDAAPRSVAAPLGRILLSVQAGVILFTVGVGFRVISHNVPSDGGQPIDALGSLGIALGLGFLISALVSYLISQRLGLIEAPVTRPEAQTSLSEQPR